jgi:FkbM family methyltransferase
MTKRISSLIHAVARWVMPRACIEMITSTRLYERRVYLRHLTTFDESTEPELTIVKQLVRANGLAVDVGANIGVYTKSLAQWVGEGGTVIAIEPVPRTHDVLSYNVRRLRLRNVIVLPYALADYDGTGRVVVPRNSQGKRNIYLAHLLSETSDLAQEAIDVPVRRLDTVLRAGESPAFIKIDVEGREFAVVKGALATIDRARPQLLVEIQGDPDDPASDAYRLRGMLCDMGYWLCVLEGARLRIRSPGDRRTNYFFLTEQIARSFL